MDINEFLHNLIGGRWICYTDSGNGANDGGNGDDGDDGDDGDEGDEGDDGKGGGESGGKDGKGEGVSTDVISVTTNVPNAPDITHNVSAGPTLGVTAGPIEGEGVITAKGLEEQPPPSSIPPAKHGWEMEGKSWSEELDNMFAEYFGRNDLDPNNQRDAFIMHYAAQRMGVTGAVITGAKASYSDYLMGELAENDPAFAYNMLAAKDMGVDIFISGITKDGQVVFHGQPNINAPGYLQQHTNQYNLGDFWQLNEKGEFVNMGPKLNTAPATQVPGIFNGYYSYDPNTGLTREAGTYEPFYLSPPALRNPNVQSYLDIGGGMSMILGEPINDTLASTWALTPAHNERIANWSTYGLFKTNAELNDYKAELRRSIDLEADPEVRKQMISEALNLGVIPPSSTQLVAAKPEVEDITPQWLAENNRLDVLEQIIASGKLDRTQVALFNPNIIIQPEKRQYESERLLDERRLTEWMEKEYPGYVKPMQEKWSMGDPNNPLPEWFARYTPNFYKDTGKFIENYLPPFENDELFRGMMTAPALILGGFVLGGELISEIEHGAMATLNAGLTINNDVRKEAIDNGVAQYMYWDNWVPMSDLSKVPDEKKPIVERIIQSYHEKMQERDYESSLKLYEDSVPWYTQAGLEIALDLIMGSAIIPPIGKAASAVKGSLPTFKTMDTVSKIKNDMVNINLKPYDTIWLKEASKMKSIYGLEGVEGYKTYIQALQRYAQDTRHLNELKIKNIQGMKEPPENFNKRAEIAKLNAENKKIDNFIYYTNSEYVGTYIEKSRITLGGKKYTTAEVKGKPFFPAAEPETEVYLAVKKSEKPTVPPTEKPTTPSPITDIDKVTEKITNPIASHPTTKVNGVEIHQPIIHDWEAIKDHQFNKSQTGGLRGAWSALLARSAGRWNPLSVIRWIDRNASNQLNDVFKDLSVWNYNKSMNKTSTTIMDAHIRSVSPDGKGFVEWENKPKTNPDGSKQDVYYATNLIKKGGTKENPLLADVYEFRKDYVFRDEYVKTHPELKGKTLDEAPDFVLYNAYRELENELAAKHGAPIHQTSEIDKCYWHRERAESAAFASGGISKPHEAPSFTKARKFDTAAEAVEAGYVFEPDYLTTMIRDLEHRLNYINDHRLFKRLENYALKEKKGGAQVKNIPDLSDKWFTKKDAETIANFFGRNPAIVDYAKTANDLAKAWMASNDFGVFFLQGGPLLALHPKEWGKAFTTGMKSFIDPMERTRWMANHLDSIRDAAYRGGISFGSSEYIEAFKYTEGMKSKFIKDTANRFKTQFITFLDTAKLSLWESMTTGRELSPVQLRQIGDHIEHMMGSINPAKLGISPRQQRLESAFLAFAANYQRASFALWTDMLTGGIKGGQAFKAFSAFFGGWAAVMLASEYINAGMAAIDGKKEMNWDIWDKFMRMHLNPEEAHWGTIKVGNVYAGPAGFHMSLLRTGILLAMHCAQPDGWNKIFNPNPNEGDLVKAWYSRMPVGLSIPTSMIMGENYMGKPLYGETIAETGALMAKNIAANLLTPMALQPAVEYALGYTPPSVDIPVLTGEVLAAFLGLRQQHDTPNQIYKLALKEGALQHGYANYDEWERKDLIAARAYLDQPDVRKLYDEAEAYRITTTKPSFFGIGQEAAREYQGWSKEYIGINNTHEADLTKLVNQYDSGEIKTLPELFDKFREADQARYKKLNELKIKWPNVYKEFEKRTHNRSISDASALSIAYNDWLNRLGDPVLYNPDGTYNYDRRAAIEKQFISDYSEDMLKDVKDAVRMGKGLPPLYRFFKGMTDDVSMSGFWQIDRNLPGAYERQNDLLEANPNVDAGMYLLGYRNHVQTDDAAAIVNNYKNSFKGQLDKVRDAPVMPDNSYYQQINKYNSQLNNLYSTKGKVYMPTTITPIYNRIREISRLSNAYGAFMRNIQDPTNEKSVKALVATRQQIKDRMVELDGLITVLESQPDSRWKSISVLEAQKTKLELDRQAKQLKNY